MYSGRMAQATLATLLGLYGSWQTVALPDDDLVINPGARQFLASIGALAPSHLRRAYTGIKQRNTSAESPHCSVDSGRFINTTLELLFLLPIKR